MTAKPDTSRVSVKSYVPESQKAIWERHADDLDMTLSEFVRTMVQAGRKPFEPEQATSKGANPRGNDVETVILDRLDEGTASWDELKAELTDDIENRLDTALERLQQESEIMHSGRAGGYKRTDHE